MIVSSTTWRHGWKPQCKPIISPIARITGFYTNFWFLLILRKLVHSYVCTI